LPVGYLYGSFAEKQYSTAYAPVGTVNFAQNMFWKIRHQNFVLNHCANVYPIYNFGLFSQAVRLEHIGFSSPKENEHGVFSYEDDGYYFPKKTEFFFSYDRKALTHDSAKTGSFGTKLHESFKDVLLRTDISANTFLAEGTTEYRAANMREFSNSPWAIKNTKLPGAEIVLEADKSVSCLVIGNGFYHAGKPDLYKKNGRPCEILITYGDVPGENGAAETMEHHVILADTYEMQFIPLLYVDRQNVRIKILSVYPGTDYDDTCLNYIGALDDPLLVSLKWRR
jgi:hypothetical protein